ncbi:DUF6528 family protein [Paenibacillus sp. GYB003]|uniref:DUF6528 family protein n=1 Tax=Paenibacillus sp. GYB003 TaxID=2994392 RepID=UPI002F968CE7
MKHLLRLTALVIAMLAAGVLNGYDSDPKTEAAAPPCCLVAITDQATNTIEAYDPAFPDWDRDEALVWSWKPGTALGYSPKEASLWNGPSDAKLKGRVLVATAGQLATVASYPSGTRIWAADVGIGSNPHSAELLPNGNIAVAASDGKWVRVYASSQGPDAVEYAEFKLDFAHATHWDEANKLLWVIGHDAGAKQHILTALRVGGTDAKPTLTEETGRRAVLPSPWGHDVAAYAGDPNKLWVSTNAEVYVYDIAAKTFTPAPDGANRSFVKSVGQLPSGQIVETRPDNLKTPPGSCKINGWCTDTVDLFSPDSTRTATGSAIYKARIWEGGSDLRAAVLKRLTAAESFYAGSAGAAGGLTKLPDDYFVRVDNDQGPIAISRFVDPANGRSYLSVVNLSLARTQTAVLHVDADRKINSVTEVSKETGAEIATDYDAGSAMLTTALTPGESRLYALPADFRYQMPERLPPEPPIVGPYTNLALHKTVTASSDYGRSGWYARAATDGLRTSTSSSMGWTSYNDIKNNHTEWIQIDMGGVYTINTVDLYPRADGKNAGLGYPTDFTIQVSEDNVSWSVAVVGHQATKPGGMLEYAFPATAARYVKVVGTNLTGDPFGNYHMQFAEIEIYARTSPLSIWAVPSRLLVGKTGTIAVVGWTRDGQIDPLSGARIRYASQDPAVATVDENGVVTAHAEGTAVIAVAVTKSDGIVESGGCEIVVESLPAPWNADFYGQAHGLISATEDGFELRANGTGFGADRDDLVFVYRDVAAANPIAVTSVIQAVYKTANGRNGHAGIMFREGGEADSFGPSVSLTVNPQGRIVMTARTKAGAIQEIKGDYTVFPVRLKLEKTGNRFVGFYEKNGAWVPVNGNPGRSGMSVNLEKSLRAGVAAFSEDAGLYTKTTVSDIRFESKRGMP